MSIALHVGHRSRGASDVHRKALLLYALWFLAGCVAPRNETRESGTSAPPVAVDPAYGEDRTPFTDQTVCFEMSVSTLNAEARAKVAGVAHYMDVNRLVGLRIEGHGDGSGTDEQNLELGDRRANALRDELARMGVDPNRIITQACGRKPQSDRGYVPGAARKWGLAEFVVLTPPE